MSLLEVVKVNVESILSNRLVLDTDKPAGYELVNNTIDVVIKEKYEESKYVR